MNRARTDSSHHSFKMYVVVGVLMLAVGGFLLPSISFADETNSQQPVPRWTYEQYYFDFSKSSGMQTTTNAAQKYDSYYTYATVDAQDGDIYFVENGSLFRTMITDSNWMPRTSLAAVNKLNVTYKMPYDEMPITWENLYLSAYVDVLSVTDWIRIWGYFQP